MKDKSRSPIQRKHPKRAGMPQSRLTASDETIAAGLHPMDMSSPDTPAIDSPRHFRLPPALRHISASAYTYARLPEHFYVRLAPIAGSGLQLVKVNVELQLRSLGLDPNALASTEASKFWPAIAWLKDPSPRPSPTQPFIKFGYFVAPAWRPGAVHHLARSGAATACATTFSSTDRGYSRYSRRGTGRAVLSDPSCCEYILGEAMAALGIAHHPLPRRRHHRRTRPPAKPSCPAPIFTRVAAEPPSWRIQFRCTRRYRRSTHPRQLRNRSPLSAGCMHAENPFSRSPRRRDLPPAHLVAQWMLIGFVHGVLNTDNTSISGETIDYGPCAFMEAYDPATVFSAIDENGRYAYANQPRITHWNLTRLAEAMLPLLEQESASQKIGSPEAGSPESPIQEPRSHASGGQPGNHVCRKPHGDFGQRSPRRLLSPVSSSPHRRPRRRKLEVSTPSVTKILRWLKTCSMLAANRADFT